MAADPTDHWTAVGVVFDGDAIEIDGANPWKHSWHLPSDSYGHTNWHMLKTMTQIRDVLLQQRADATAQLREVEACMQFTVNAMIEMEKERDFNLRQRRVITEALEAKND